MLLLTSFSWILSVRVHSSPGVPYHPTLQVQSPEEELPTGDSEFIGQCVIPPSEQYLSTGHSVQTSLVLAYDDVMKQESTMIKVLSIV